MASYICLIQFKEQGILNIKDTVKRGDAAVAEAEKMGMKIVEEYWTMGAYDAVVGGARRRDDERVHTQGGITWQREGRDIARVSPQ